MSIFKTKGYRDLNCVLSIAAIFPPPERARTLPDRKTDDELTFHMTIVNNREQLMQEIQILKNPYYYHSLIHKKHEQESNNSLSTIQ